MKKEPFDCNNTLTLFQYEMLPLEIIDEFKEILEIFKTRGFIKYRNTDRVLSKYANFAIENNSLRVCVFFRSSDKSCYNSANCYSGLIYVGSNYNVSYPFDTDYDSYSNSVGRAAMNTFRRIYHQHLLEDNFTNISIEDFDNMVQFNNEIYYEKVFFSSPEISDCYNQISGYSIPLNRVHPYWYNRFEMSEDSLSMTFSFKGRSTTMRVGKGFKKIAKILGHDVADENIKKMVNRITGNFADYEMRLVSGDDIDKYYDWKQYDYDVDLGSLGGSCMRGSECVDNNFFQVYKENASMLIFVNKTTDKIIGRAIVWKAIDLVRSEPIVVMDRIYSSEKVYEKFFTWAKNNDCYRKRYQSHGSEYLFVRKDGEEVHLDMAINVSLTDYRYLPYMDTFAWGDNDCIRNNSGFGFYTARSTCGDLGCRRD